jgi:membrane protein DedA with SNARE-associated domain
MERLREKGYIGIFIGKLIPMIRTVISIPAGVLKMNFLGYTLFSALGITVWNLVFVGAGYFFGDTVLGVLA